MNKYVKVMFGSTSGANNNLNYKIDEVNVCKNWNPTAKDGKDFGGFNYTTDDSIIRWLHRGDTIYNVEIPDDAENIRIDGATIIYRTNKIIVSNPRKIDDDLAYYFYTISNIPEKSYYKALGAVSIMNYKKTAYTIIKDKVNENNIDDVLEEWNDFISCGNKNDRKDLNGFVKDIEDYLYEIKSDLLISRFVDKEPYIKDITNDKVINLTGESGSGKSYYSKKYLNNDDFIVIDTDIIFGNRPSNNKESLEIRELFKNKDKDSFITNFDECYKKILDYFKDTDKTIVIDSAQFRNIKDISILKGKVIVMRTSIEECYKRVLDRWKNIMNNNYNEDDFNKYANRKLGMFSWYKGLNEFLDKVDII